MTKSLSDCRLCQLHKTRTNLVVQRGNPKSTFWLVGEAPGKNEDLQGKPFVGRAGTILDACLTRASVKDFNIENVLRCRPPENRDPHQVEFFTCSTWLKKRLQAVNPHIVIAMGRYSIGFFQNLSWRDLTNMHVTTEIQNGPFLWNRVHVFPSFHPAYLARNPEYVRGLIFTLANAKNLHDTLVKPKRTARPRR